MLMTKTTMGTIICLVFMVGISMVYFSKEREKTIENKFFNGMIITNVIGLIVHVIVEYAAFFYVPIISSIILKCVLYYYVTYTAFFLSYLLLIIKLKHANFFIKLTNIILLITYVIVTVLPEKLFVEGEIAYTYGP
ncbi:MAG: hypothetical protein Q4E69_07420, partial [Bacilli bacterium]|nr:hypothetical protein [Bacilli bacterium]